MSNWTGRIMITTIAILLAIMPAATFQAQDSDKISRSSLTRDQSGFISDDSFYVHNEYDTDNMWVVVWMENKDKYRIDVPDSDYYLYFREVANSFAFPVDGSQHSSGNKRIALVELFTATDCVYCPGAEGALDRLVQERFPDDFSLIEWHIPLQSGNDPYETGSSQGRLGSYHVEARPTTIVDGENVWLGGDQNPQNKELYERYGEMIDIANDQRPLVSFSGSADYVGDFIDYNITFQSLNPIPRGNWTISVAICEDLQKDHSGATLRHTQRGSVKTKRLDDLHQGYPEVNLDVDSSLDGKNNEEVRGNLTILWDAFDAQDGSDVDIDIIYRTYDKGYGPWQELETSLSNTGSFVWNTMEPRYPDGIYDLRLIATDSDGNSVITSKRLLFELNNLDHPMGNITFPQSGDSLKERATVRWVSDDDEDDTGDMLARISIRNGSEAEWRIISYNQVTQGDWIANTGRFEFNTLNYDDLSTYRLRIDLRDTHGLTTTLFSDIFEIYNNDRPTAIILSPEQGETITEILDIGWKVSDQEDPPSAISGNFSVKKGEGDWIILFEGPLDNGMENKTFSTSELRGDGAYTLKFTVTDSRGLEHSTKRDFEVYNPDPPVFTSVSGPGDLSDIRADSIGISWECSDDDQGEVLSYSVEISPHDEENWTQVAEDLTDTSISVDLSGLEEGNYRVRVTAEDSSEYGLTDQITFGPIFYNAPDAPELYSMTDDLEGVQFPSDANETLEEGKFTLEILWGSDDPDNDNVTYSIYFATGDENEWKLLKEGLSQGSYEWNLTGKDSGSYRIKIVGTDDSDDSLSSDLILGPFTWTNVFREAQQDDDDDNNGNSESAGDVETDDGPDVTAFILIGIASVVLVVIVVIISIFIASRIGRKKEEDDVIPTQEQVDYNSIPEFDRAGPNVGPQTQVPAQTQQTSPPPKQFSPGSVKWNAEDQGEQGQVNVDRSSGEIQGDQIRTNNQGQDQSAGEADQGAGEPMAPPPSPPQ